MSIFRYEGTSVNIKQYLWVPRSIEYLAAGCLRYPIARHQARRGLIFAVARRSLASTQGYHPMPSTEDEGEEGPFWPGGWCSAGFCVGSTRLQESPASLLCCHSFCLSCLLSLILLLLLFISYFIAVSSKLYLSQPMFFTLWAFNSPLHPTAGAKETKQEAQRSECFSESTKLVNNLPKPQHSFIWT